MPKGFLRYLVLELLSEKPLSGSEIMEEVERRTFGYWRPSPGSVYPLLAWLQDNSYIQEVPTEESGVRRYTLTDRGRQLLEEQRRIKRHLREHRKLFTPPFLGALWLHIPHEEAEKLRAAAGRLLRALMKLAISLEDHFTSEAMRETSQILEETARRLEELNRKLCGGEEK